MKRVVLIGIGGASCSGKTILAKHLRSVLPGSLLIHQDDFAPPASDLPYTGDPPVQDWDDPETAIKWPDFRTTLRDVKQKGIVTYSSHDHLNELPGVGVDAHVKAKWASKFSNTIQWVIVEGFVLYWDEEATSELDHRFFLRVPRETLQSRREQRQTYVLEDGTVWTDPPNYFQTVVYPAYLKAYKSVLNGDVEHGSSSQLTVLEPADGDMTAVFEAACRAIETGIEE